MTSEFERILQEALRESEESTPALPPPLPLVPTMLVVIPIPSQPLCPLPSSVCQAYVSPLREVKGSYVNVRL